MNHSSGHGVPPIVHEVLRSPGQPLDVATRAFMEPRFGHDFSGVRVHTDAKAAESARAVNALAYTVGRNVVFGAGQYLPQTNAGQRLLAHELTHTVQQIKSESAPDSLRLASASGAEETQAEHWAEWTMQTPAMLPYKDIPLTKGSNRLIHDFPSISLTTAEPHIARRPNEPKKAEDKQSTDEAN